MSAASYKEEVAIAAPPYYPAPPIGAICCAKCPAWFPHIPGLLMHAGEHIRQWAEEARQREFEATVIAAEEKLVEVREAALLRVPETAKEVLELFIPKVSGGTQS